MKPVFIFRHVAGEGPGYLAEYFSRRDIPFRLIRVDANEPLPESIDNSSGFVFMGGPMSVNDPLPWIPRTLALIRQAVAADLPVLGHCLGAQLMSRALGGRVTRNRVKEIGWLPVARTDAPEATQWFDGIPPVFEAFHWHGETFSIPPGAAHLLKSRHCRNQAFAIGRSLGLQCHIEMTPAMVRLWAQINREEIKQANDTVQSAARMRIRLGKRVAALQAIADRIYDRWLAGVRRA
jgi:GMP synthase-like glutamine amidotransferase